MTMHWRMALLGCGRLGTALACELFRRGTPLAAIADRNAAKARELAQMAGAQAVPPLGLVEAADLIFIAISDDSIETVATQLSQAGSWRGKMVLHTSGSLDASVLGRLKDAGAAVGSIHPMQSFSGGQQIPAGTVFGIEGDPAAVQAAQALVRHLEGTMVQLTSQSKPLYHAAASVAANYLVTLLDTAKTMLETAGLNDTQAVAALLPLVGGVLENVRRNGTVQALTGPIARGDVKTVEKHLAALDRYHPELRGLYQVLGEKTLELARKAGLDGEKAERLAAVIR
jgi:predicted short-subunit dehydrogenase-like oxidoreductase (DUF2520 family)